jgi:hypothetical protein
VPKAAGYPLSDIPIKPGHDGKSLAGNLLRQMFVRRMLRAAGIGMRHPDGAQFQDIDEDMAACRDMMESLF